MLCIQRIWLTKAIRTDLSLLQAEKSLYTACTSETDAYTLLHDLTLLPPNHMSKQDLIAAIADAAGITKRAAGDALQAIINIVIKNLKKGTPVTITGFGTFKLSNRAARMGVNPRNPTQKISIPSMKVPSFKAGKTLKDAVR